MRKVVFITILFTSLFVSLYSIDDDPKVIKYDKSFVYKVHGKVVLKLHKQLILYNDRNILEDVLNIDYLSIKRRTYRIIRYKNNHFNRPLTAEVKTYIKGNLTQESKLIFQKKTYSFTSTQYQTEYKKLNPPKKMSRNNFTISKNPLHFNHSLDTIGIRMIEKEKKKVAYVVFPTNPLVFGDILDYQEGPTLTKESDANMKTTTYKIFKKVGIGRPMVTLQLNKKKEITSYKFYSSELIEIKKEK